MQGFDRILFVMEPGQEPAWALARAGAFAANVQADLTLLMVAERPAATAELNQAQVEAAIRDQCLATMQGALAALAQPIEAECLVAFGRPHIEIIRTVLRGGHDLVIKAAEPQGGGLRARWLGSRDMHLLRKCPCPVWLLKPDGRQPYRRILATVDFTPGADEDAETEGLNRRILDLASALALAEFAELHVAHVWEAPATGFLHHWAGGVWTTDTTVDELRYVEQTRNQHVLGVDGLIKALAERIGPEGLEYLKPRSHLQRGSAIEEIPALAVELDVDLIVMGTVGRGGIPGLLIGNTAETILDRCDRAVLAVKPPSFETPVSLGD
jgi:universal stress protein E